MDCRMSFSRHIDVTVGKTLAMLGFVKRLSGEFRDPYTLRNLYVSLVHPKLEYASCVWRLFMTWSSVELRVCRGNSLNTRCEVWDGWTCMIFLHAWNNVLWSETLTRRRSDVCVMFVFDVLSGRIGSPNLLFLVNVITPRYRTRGGNFLRIDFHRSNYGVHGPLNDAVWHFYVYVIFISRLDLFFTWNWLSRILYWSIIKNLAYPLFLSSFLPVPSHIMFAVE
jgi:hypothetical protein